MLTDEELAAIRDENERRSDLRDEDIINRLLAEITELRLVLRDALQDNTPGNRVWREGVKAALEAAARAAEEPRFQKWSYEGVLTIKTDLAEYIRAIDPSTILPGIL